MNKTLIVIFCYNVEKHILKIIYEIKKLKLNKNRDFLFIEDCSTDRTLQILNNNILSNFKILKNKKNQGFGKNYKFSIKYSIKKNYTKLIFLHGDNQYPTNKIELLEKRLDYSALAYGSRKLNYLNMKNNMPKSRLLANIILTKMINFLLGSKATEFFSGFRGLEVKKLKNLDLNKLADEWVIEQQIHFQFIKKNYRINEIPIPTSYKHNQKSEIPPFRYVISVILSVFKYAFK